MSKRMRSSSQHYGYEDHRFRNVVNPSLHCLICQNVLKDPKMCRSNQHAFCTPCIIGYLRNSSTCPECGEELTVGTLTEPTRDLRDSLSELNIKCDYFSRGCRDFVQLGDLQTHVMNCGFAPAQCSNQGCSAEVNERDRVHHEKEVCEFRKVKCHDCSEIRKGIDEVKRNQAEMENQLPSLKEDLKAVKEDIKEVKAMLVKMMDKLNNGEQFIPVPPQVKSNTKQDIIIAGGYDTKGTSCSSVQVFNWDRGAWATLPPMKESRAQATSFVYENQIIVTGGETQKYVVTDSMEMLRTDQEPLQWATFPAKLPAQFSGHKTLVYQDRLIVIGGYDDRNRKFSDAISEVRLVPPYSTKWLCRILQPRMNHGAELFDDKILILGGRTNFQNKNVINSIILYDVSKNECKQIPPLPYAVRGMSTVSWRNKVIVIGGKDKNGQVLDHVVMYDIETEVIEKLPSMKYKRSGCSAVVIGNDIVVMGGWNMEHKYLNSVECFSLVSNSWQELPPMIERREWATAVVKSVKFD